MPTVHFTSQLERFLPAPTVSVAGRTLREALTNVFADHPMLKGYIVDDQGTVRRHVAIFIDGIQLRDRVKLTDPVGEKSEIHVFQALSGG
ncbi:MAG: MoaD/ThiS family protein [Proteobacteria bacterium]|nr:MoaD/ThiS family protein [Pseudomonadota bacterium]